MYIYHISINSSFPSDAIAIESHILQRQVNQNNIQFKSWPYPKGTKAIFCIHQIKCQIIVIPIYISKMKLETFIKHLISYIINGIDNFRKNPNCFFLFLSIPFWLIEINHIYSFFKFSFFIYLTSYQSTILLFEYQQLFFVLKEKK